MINSKQGGILGAYKELVMVTLQAVAGPHSAHLPVGLVHHHVVPLPVSGVHAFPPGEYRLAPVALELEVHHVHGLAAHGAKPHRLAHVVQDQAAVLTRTCLPGTVFGSAKDVAGGRVVGLGGHPDAGGLQIGAASEGPGLLGRGRRGRGAGAGGGFAAHRSPERAAQGDPGGAPGRDPEEPPPCGPCGPSLVSYPSVYVSPRVVGVSTISTSRRAALGRGVYRPTFAAPTPSRRFGRPASVS